MTRPSAAMLVIGDEILSGRTRDANMYHLAGKLTEHGIELKEVRVVADDRVAIVSAARSLGAAHDHVFTSGGIGPTHDDITAECIAEAFGAKIGIRDDARAILAAHYKESSIELNDARLRMARIPEGATLIENPVSAAPGFTLGNVHVLAGVPRIFEAMLVSVLATIAGGAALLSVSLRLERGEGDIAAPLGQLAEAHPDLSFGSYPFQAPEGFFGTNVVIRGTNAVELQDALAKLSKLLNA